MFDPLVIVLLILAAVLGIGLVGVPLYLRRNPTAQAAVLNVLPDAWDARLIALENALPSKADLQAELAKVEADLAPVRAKMVEAEAEIAEWLKAHGYTVSKP